MTEVITNEIVDIAGNPRPQGARIVWFEGINGRKLRACLAGLRFSFSIGRAKASRNACSTIR